MINLKANSSLFLVFGLGFLFFSFVISFSAFNAFGDYFHFLIALEDSTNHYAGFVFGAFLYCVLPIAVALALFILTYVKEKELQNGSFEYYLMLIVGGFCVFWGFLHIRGAFITYFHAVEHANNLHISYIKDSLLAIYAIHGVFGILWLVTGVFLPISTYKLMKSRRLAKPAAQVN